MRRRMGQKSIRGRRGTHKGTSATVVCLAATLAACATDGNSEGYVAVQRPASSGEAVAPTGDVELVPLEGSTGKPGTGTSGSPGNPGSKSAGRSASAASGPNSASGSDGNGRTTPTTGGNGPDTDSGAASGSSGTGAPSGGAQASPAAPARPGPAVLGIGDPEREPADKRWCEKVTVGFHNTGGTAVRSGTVTFGTHIIGALGIDWATVESAEKLPAPIAPGAREEKTWTVCVDAWHVPLGMRVETRDVSVRWE
ncbi:hypothetical protein [Streptomyces sp. NBC_00878]|uniref:hypothetical protein n=1 Tax=Streptomyces sp. NBC_00878 TaxID=2975854 RepID=UPI00225022F8|nr:hypothetical protein [Streptomyces sp. NBC_00878]MCX4907025.1 hypothetical protein [Streptomyces sp. NBC_00878]